MHSSTWECSFFPSSIQDGPDKLPGWLDDFWNLLFFTIPSWMLNIWVIEDTCVDATSTWFMDHIWWHIVHMNLCDTWTYRHTLITYGHWTRLDDYITFFLECLSKQLQMQTMTDHVSLNGWFLLRQPINCKKCHSPYSSSTCLKDQSLCMSGGAESNDFLQKIFSWLTQLACTV